MKNKFKFFLFLILVLVIPSKTLAQDKRILFTGGILHDGDGGVIENSVFGISGGKINLTGDARLVRIASDAYDTVINIDGKHIYPGLIAMHTVIGLSEIEAVRATNDFNEAGTFNPSARSLVAYNTDSKVIPTIRSNGVLLAQVVPKGGLFPGRSSVMKLEGWNYEDAVIKPDEGMHLNWPSMRVVRGSRADSEEKQREKSEKALTELRKIFEDAKAYAHTVSPVPANINFEAMKGLFDSTMTLYVYCNYIREIIAAVNFCKEMKVKMVLVGGTDAWKVTSLLKENNIPVVLIEMHRLPSSEDEDVDMPYKLPALLVKEGLKVAITTGGFWQVRNLPFHAGTAAAYGLGREEALAAITKVPAEILGISDVNGMLKQGMSATFIISEGDLLDMKTSVVTSAFINGSEVNIANMQTELYKKYKVKYGLE